MFKRYALINNGIVTNIVEQADAPPAEFNPVESLDAQIGDAYDGTAFIKPVVVAPVMPVIPYTVRRQLRFSAEADPLFFQEQRGEVPVGTWAAKVAEIKADIPRVQP